MTTNALARSEEAVVRALVVLTGGGLLLLLRAQALELGGARAATLVALYGVLAVLSLRMPVPRARPGFLARPVVAAVGIAAVFAVAYAPWQLGALPVYGVTAAALGAIAAVAEEAFFRRFMYGWLEEWWGAFAAIALTALAFALVHIPLYGTSVLWVDLGAGILLSWQRWAAGSWGPAAATHVTANLLVALR